MWPTWLRSLRRTQTTTLSSSPPSRSRSCGFSCSSFKDIHTLLIQPESPSLIHSFNTSTTTTTTRTVTSSSSSSSSSYFVDHSSTIIVLYYTSLRVVRRTFEDCRVVRSILQGFGVAIDERDVSIDNSLRDELRDILLQYYRWNVTLPCVFIGGKYIGDADDVRRLYDSGELQCLIERLPRLKKVIDGCDFCGGMRFVVCDECDGSHKVFIEKIGFRTCYSCNANGLIRCPSCFFMLPRHTK